MIEHDLTTRRYENNLYVLGKGSLSFEKRVPNLQGK